MVHEGKLTKTPTIVQILQDPTALDANFGSKKLGGAGILLEKAQETPISKETTRDSYQHGLIRDLF